MKLFINGEEVARGFSAIEKERECYSLIYDDRLKNKDLYIGDYAEVYIEGE